MAEREDYAEMDMETMKQELKKALDELTNK